LQPNFQKVVAMDPFVAYSIPIKGLKVGIHQFKYTLDHAFFRHFEDSPIENGNVEVEVVLDKRETILVFDFSLEGYTDAICDRCTAPIQLPLHEDARQLVVKYGDAEGDDDDDEVVFISREALGIPTRTVPVRICHTGATDHEYLRLSGRPKSALAILKY
jgi:hypothetical protein